MGDNKATSVEILQKSDDIDQNTIEYKTSNREFQEEYVTWTFNNKKDYGSIDFHNSKVSCISFYSDSSISLGEIVEQIGYPDKLLLSKTRLDGVYITAEFIYEEGMSFQVEKSVLSIFNPKQINISPNMDISLINLYDQELIGKNKYFMIGVNNIDSPQSKLYDWNGYGNYEFLRDQWDK